METTTRLNKMEHKLVDVHDSTIKIKLTKVLFKSYNVSMSERKQSGFVPFLRRLTLEVNKIILHTTTAF